MVILQFYNYIVYHIHVKTLSGIDFGGWNPETGLPREGAEHVMKAQAGAWSDAEAWIDPLCNELADHYYFL